MTCERLGRIWLPRLEARRALFFFREYVPFSAAGKLPTGEYHKSHDAITDVECNAFDSHPFLFDHPSSLRAWPNNGVVRHSLRNLKPPLSPPLTFLWIQTM